LTARGVRVLAISGDSPEDSRAFAERYAIAFPLLSDPDGVVSRRYTGISSDDHTVPGVMIVQPDRKIAYRQVATAKDDRVTTGDLLATLDRTLGTHGPALADAHYAAIARAQLRLDAGGGANLDGRGNGTLHLTGLYPVRRWFVAGLRATANLHEAPFTGDVIAALRLPIFADAGALELGGFAGVSPMRVESGAVRYGGNATLWFALSPSWSVQLAAEIDTRRELAATFGIGRLFELP
jgi:hypothetical protein